MVTFHPELGENVYTPAQLAKMAAEFFHNHEATELRGQIFAVTTMAAVEAVVTAEYAYDGTKHFGDLWDARRRAIGPQAELAGSSVWTDIVYPVFGGEDNDWHYANFVRVLAAGSALHILETDPAYRELEGISSDRYYRRERLQADA